MLIPPLSRPISLPRFQICRPVTPGNFICIRFTSSLIHELKRYYNFLLVFQIDGTRFDLSRGEKIQRSSQKVL